MKQRKLLLIILGILLVLAVCSFDTILQAINQPATQDIAADSATESTEDFVPLDDDWDITEPDPIDTLEPDNNFSLDENVEIDDDPWDEPDNDYSSDSTEGDSGSNLELQTSTETIDEDGYYYQKDDVALYIYTYEHLPDNYITKKEAQALGWSGGTLESIAPGMVIGGDRYGNYEGILPQKKGRKYTECDIDTLNQKRGEKRIVFSNDGLIYYTEDHYQTFELLYGEP